MDYYEAIKLSNLQSKNPYIDNNDNSRMFQSIFSDLKDNNLSNFYESIKNKKSNIGQNDNLKRLVNNLGNDNNSTNQDKDNKTNITILQEILSDINFILEKKI